MCSTDTALQQLAGHVVEHGAILPDKIQHRVGDINRAISKVVSDGESAGNHAAKPVLRGGRHTPDIKLRTSPTWCLVGWLTRAAQMNRMSLLTNIWTVTMKLYHTSSTLHMGTLRPPKD